VGKSLEETGMISEDELKKAPGVPSMERLSKGAVAILECVQEIPCDPCKNACPKGAIIIDGDITNLPRLRADICTGCGLCIPHCPGLAIFVVNMVHSKNNACIMMPYEYLPLPKAGDEVSALDREGNVVGRAKVIKVVKRRENNKTPLIQIKVRKELGMAVRNIKMR